MAINSHYDMEQLLQIYCREQRLTEYYFNVSYFYEWSIIISIDQAKIAWLTSTRENS